MSQVFIDRINKSLQSITSNETNILIALRSYSMNVSGTKGTDITVDTITHPQAFLTNNANTLGNLGTSTFYNQYATLAHSSFASVTLTEEQFSNLDNKNANSYEVIKILTKLFKDLFYTINNTLIASKLAGTPSSTSRAVTSNNPDINNVIDLYAKGNEGLFFVGSNVLGSILANQSTKAFDKSKLALISDKHLKFITNTAIPADEALYISNQSSIPQVVIVPSDITPTADTYVDVVRDNKTGTYIKVRKNSNTRVVDVSVVYSSISSFAYKLIKPSGTQ